MRSVLDFFSKIKITFGWKKDSMFLNINLIVFLDKLQLLNLLEIIQQQKKRKIINKRKATFNDFVNQESSGSISEDLIIFDLSRHNFTYRSQLHDICNWFIIIITYLSKINNIYRSFKFKNLKKTYPWLIFFRILIRFTIILTQFIIIKYWPAVTMFFIDFDRLTLASFVYFWYFIVTCLQK